MHDDGDMSHAHEGARARDAIVHRIVALIREHVKPGLIVELGVRDGTLGSELVGAGYAYLGISDQPTALQDLERLGLRGVRTSLDDPRQLERSLDGLGQIEAMCLVGVLDRLTAPDHLLAYLSAFATRTSTPRLLVTAPNVGRRDVGLRLLSGHLPDELAFAVTSGRRHLFTGPTLATLLHSQGWTIVARHDVRQMQQDSRESENLALSPTLMGDFLRYASKTLNPDDEVDTFVWMLAPATASMAAPRPGAGRQPLVSILMRTMGKRNDLLTEAIASVYGQNDQDYELLLCLHSPGAPDDSLKQGVEQVVASFPPDLQEKTRIIECHGGGRGAPLNALAEAAVGVYASILDDDDLLFEHHVAMIRQGVDAHGPTVLFQTYAAQRLIDLVEHVQTLGSSGGSSASDGQYPYTVVSMSVPWDVPIDPVRQHHENMVPICSLAFPLQLIRQTTLRFRTDIEVGEEWAFWMDALQFYRVVVLPEVTAAVNHRNDTVTNAMRRPEAAVAWRQVRDARHQQAAGVPLLLDGESRQRLAEAGRRLEEAAALRELVAKQQARLESIYASRFWRVARRLWSLHGRLSTARRLLRAGPGSTT